MPGFTIGIKEKVHDNPDWCDNRPCILRKFILEFGIKIIPDKLAIILGLAEEHFG